MHLILYCLLSVQKFYITKLSNKCTFITYVYSAVKNRLTGRATKLET